ncbi:MAG: 5'-3' exonuclease H3TH domain-containing protein [bacterium]
MPIRRLILVDGHAVMYRSFYGIPELSTADGRPTNAVFGFIRMIRQVRQKWQPTHMIVVFDGGMPPRRLALLSTYKAQRPPMPEPLRGQFAIAEEYLQRADIPWLKMQLEEGDDVIATLARKAEVDGSEVLIVTNDKDMYQLVNEHTRMVPPSDTDKIVAIDEIRTKTGVGPDKIIEWLALIGDASDNINGVPGVGPKTAAKLLAQHGSIEGIFKGLAEVTSHGIRKALEQSRDIVMRNMELIRLSCDLECAPDWMASEVRPENPDVLRPFLKDLELNSLMKEWSAKREKSILTLDAGGRCDTLSFNFD